MNGWKANWSDSDPEFDTTEPKSCQSVPTTFNCGAIIDPILGIFNKGKDETGDGFSLLDQAMFKCSREDLKENKEEQEERKKREIDSEVQRLVAIELEKRMEEEEDKKRIEETQRREEELEMKRKIEEQKEEEIRNAVLSAIMECEERAAEEARQEEIRRFAETYSDIQPTKQALRRANSKNASPIQQYSVDVRIDALDELRNILNRTLEDGLTLDDLLLRASLLTMRAIPSANARWMDDHVRIFKKIDVNVSVQGAEYSIFTPRIDDAAAKGLRELSETLRSMEERAKNGQLADDEECEPGTFCVQNLGKLGVKSFTPILPDDQACLLAVGSPEQRAIPSDDKKSKVPYVMGTMITATLVCDDKLVDAVTGSKWLNTYKNHIENPTTLLL